MNTNAATIVGEGIIKGSFDVLDAMLAESFEQQPQQPIPLDDAVLNDLLEKYPVALHGTIENDLGALCMLLSTADAARFAAIILETEVPDPPALDDTAKETLKEIADPALGGGVTNVMERVGHDIEQLTAVNILEGGAALTGQISEVLGGDSTSLEFTFSAPSGFSGAGAILYSQSLEDLVPDDDQGGAPADGDDLAAEPTLSDAEMTDILSGFGPETGGVPGIVGQQSPTNIEMVLGIELEATARLGRVEMPISEILNLGPGSIVEMGQMVDEPVELLINDKLIARGDVVVVDEKFGLRITEIISPVERIESLR
jgi:flagellar motor switch protein FliN/FliY